MKQLSIFTILISIIFLSFSCQKTEKTQKGQKPGLNPISYIYSPSELEQVFEGAKFYHNNFLENLYTPMGSLHLSSMSQEDIRDFLRDYDSSYFSSMNFSDSTIGLFNNVLFPQILDSTYMLNAIASDTIISNLMNWIESTAIDGSSLTSVFAFSYAVQNKLSDIINDPFMSNENQATCAAILGVADGSFQFWNDEIHNWDIYMQHQGKPSKTLTEKQRKIADLLIADARGGSWGSLIGSLAPIVGNVAGAVMGGSILSAMEALSWK